MGNYNSLKKRLKCRHRNKNTEKQNYTTEGTMNIIEDFEGTSSDSYEKLIAWMIEMSENDDVALNSNSFVEHLAKVCAEKQQRQSFTSIPPRQHSLDSSTYNSVSHSRPRYMDRHRVPFKQHSYDAATFHSVSPVIIQSSLDSQPGMLNSQSGLLDVNTPFRQHSSDSSCSSKSRYSKPSRANSRSREDLLDPRTRFRRAMFSRQGTVDFSDGESPDFNDASMDISGGSSFEHDSDIDIVDPTSVLLNKNCRETSFIKDSRSNKKTNDDVTYPGISSSVGDLLHTRTGFSDVVRNKSKSLSTMRRIKSECRNDEEITPITETDESYTILEDSLLDGNIADILYSVEALWPKGNNKITQGFY